MFGLNFLVWGVVRAQPKGTMWGRVLGHPRLEPMARELSNRLIQKAKLGLGLID